MNFEEMLKTPGLYRAEGFADGTAFEVDKFGFLNVLNYQDKHDLMPTKERPVIYAGLLNKDYTTVFNRGQLFSTDEK